MDFYHIHGLKVVHKNGSNDNLIISKVSFQYVYHQLDIDLIDFFAAGRIQNNRQFNTQMLLNFCDIRQSESEYCFVKYSTGQFLQIRGKQIR